jgi:hypothetical protein
MSISENIKKLKGTLPQGVQLIAVSKTKPDEAILGAYESGHRDFGENKVQELVDKQSRLPHDINWHMIGHLQTNKVKYIVPFVHLIHSVDRLKLAKEIDRRAQQHDRVVDVLLQVHIAAEEHKFGFSEQELNELMENQTLQSLQHIRVRGLMGMATFTSNQNQVISEFQQLNSYFKHVKSTYLKEDQYFNTLSMGMSGDYELAIEAGSNMVRVGSAIFGSRN